MILNDFIERLKLENPNLKASGVSDTYLTGLVNKACDQVNLICKVYAGSTDFNIEAEKRVYPLSTYVPLYLGRDKRGLYFLNSSSEWDKLIPKTEAWISQRYPNYLNADSVDVPTYYGIEGDELFFYPPPSTTTSSGGRLYHLKKAVAMTASTHYPYSGSTTEITALLPLDEAIIAYVNWKLKPAYGANTDIDLGERRFLAECRLAKGRIKSAPDLSVDADSGMSL
jgi:hypothetical protein